MHLTEQELKALTEEVDQTHQDGMRTFREEVSELHLEAARAKRRKFMVAGGVIGTAAVAGPMLLSGMASARAPMALTDENIAGFAQSVELAAVAAYTMGAPLLTAATLPVAKLFMSHHQQHADAFGSVAGSSKVTAANPKLVAALTPTLAGLKTETDVLNFAFVLEGQAAYTYAAALTLLMNPAFAAATATILPIEAQHQVVLGLALGKSPADVFPTKAFESTALGDGTDPLKGLDPATFG